MLETIEATLDEQDVEAVWADVVRVCERIPPLWDLTRFVAVNPFVGFTARPLVEAAREIGDALDARVLPGIDYYRARWKEGAFTRADLAAAAGRAGWALENLLAILDGRGDPPRRKRLAPLTFAERHDRRCGSAWNDAIIRSIARWCAVHASSGGVSWKLAGEARGLYAAWREAETVDRSLEIAGLRGWRRWVEGLPDRPDEAIMNMLERLAVPADVREAYLYRLLGGLYGWASYLRRSSWQEPVNGPGPLAELLAIRLCADAAVVELAPVHHGGSPRWKPAAHGRDSVDDEAVSVVFQEALEDGFSGRLFRNPHLSSPPVASPRPAVQGVFCIDVRSEPLRRHLEAQSAAIETFGFAGSFGVGLDWRVEGRGDARCPVLLRPTLTLKPAQNPPQRLARAVLKQLQGAPAALFSYVEVSGLAYAIALVVDALTGLPKKGSREDHTPFALDPDGEGGGLDLESRVDLAAGILKNMGFRGAFGRLVLLCGHEGRSANNPHAAGLHCGACAGHGGGLNARVAAAVLNDPRVRAGLSPRGWEVPGDCHFVPGVHDTTVDEVRLLDVDQVPLSHQSDLDRLRRWLDQAGALVRSERAAALGLDARPVNVLKRLMRRRSRDSSETRPEWGLAGNAAFIVAPRRRTRGVDLQGRAFLHDYDWATDLDGSILSMILSAPMVVASWINLQYFASTVDNDVFGCGTKTLHNRVGTLGVVLGNGGDLRPGLASQSVHAADGEWFHEPLRLQVVVEAPRERIDQVLFAQPGVRDLVDNGWVRLFAIEPDGDTTARWVPGEGWSPVDEQSTVGLNPPHAARAQDRRDLRGDSRDSRAHDLAGQSRF